MISWTQGLLRQRIFWLALLIITWLISTNGKAIAKALDMRWIVKYPSAWKWRLKDDISKFMQWLVDEASIGVLRFIDITRGISWLIEQPYQLALMLFSKGLVTGQGSEAIHWLPPLSWIAVIMAIITLGYYARDIWLAFIAGAAFIYLAVFGQWDSAMITLASIVIAVPLGAIVGLLLGISMYRHIWLRRLITPLLDLMQTVPVFAYLVPILFLFGFGPVSALIATIIYAMPPMARVTLLSLKGIDPEIRELGTMTGCNRRQLMWRVLLPVARSDLMVGVNQVIMLSLNMVIIASMIGAGGLGYDVLTSLRKLDIGGGIEAGVAIVVLAIALDRISQALSEKRVLSNANAVATWWRRYPRTLLVIVIAAVCLLAGKLVPLIQSYPPSLQISTGEFWKEQVRFLNVNYFDHLEAFKTTVLTWFLLPIKRFILGIPWPWGILLIALIAARFGGWRLSLACVLMTAFIIANGLWTKAMITVYLCGASVIIACLIGIPLGIASALNHTLGKITGSFIDTLQTLPSFVYLIPVVTLPL